MCTCIGVHRPTALLCSQAQILFLLSPYELLLLSIAHKKSDGISNVFDTVHPIV